MAHNSPKNGLLLLNLGTPKRPDVLSVRHYLREFLLDKRVIELNTLLRYALVYGVILPFRAPKTAQAYQAIWTQEGSPLLTNSLKLLHKLQARLRDEYVVALGMRYGAPSIEDALRELQACSKITVLPLYPQYSSAATGSSIEKTLHLLSKQTVLPSLSIIRDFYQNEAFINTQATLIKPYLKQHDFILFSYHGLPENHLIQAGCHTVCTQPCPLVSSHHCYRQQCFKTSELIAKRLGLSEQNYTTSFQSRLGKTPWIKPYTDDILPALAARGVQHLAIACPSFVADCLETLEEIRIRAQKQWQALGKTDFTLIPSLNDNDEWIDAILNLL